MSSKTNAKDAVLKYLTSQNRPYSANDITQNLHKEYGKTAIQKALDELAEDNRIREKVYGKQKVYSALQPDKTDDMDMEVTLLDSKITELSDKLKVDQDEVKKCETVLKGLGDQLTAEEAKSQRRNLEQSVAKLSEKIAVLSKTSGQISQKERDEIYKHNDKYVKEYRKRKRMCNDILNAILENYPKPKKVLYEESGIETDEDVGCKVNLYDV